MNNDYFETNAVDDIRYGDVDFDQEETDNAKTLYLSAIAKVLVEIRDELRRFNDAK